jgi:DNA-binding transcriptional LysR family regulator
MCQSTLMNQMASARTVPRNVATRDSLRNLRVSLQEWRSFHAVIECGGYTNAAEFLHRTQPAISYTIAKLERRLGIPLLKIEGRKAQLTEMGMKLLVRSRMLLEYAVELEQFADSLRHFNRTEAPEP